MLLRSFNIISPFIFTREYLESAWFTQCMVLVIGKVEGKRENNSRRIWATFLCPPGRQEPPWAGVWESQRSSGTGHAPGGAGRLEKQRGGRDGAEWACMTSSQPQTHSSNATLCPLPWKKGSRQLSQPFHTPALGVRAARMSGGVWEREVISRAAARGRSALGRRRLQGEPSLKVRPAASRQLPGAEAKQEEW